MKELVTVLNELKDLDFNKDQRREAIEQMGNSDDFTIDADGGEFRFIHRDEIDDVLKEELERDEYMLGCFTPWFIADITGLDVDIIEKAQKNDSMELLSALMLKHIDEVAQGYVSIDGYGPHFAHSDHNEHKIGEYLVFRTN